MCAARPILAAQRGPEAAAEFRNALQSVLPKAAAYEHGASGMFCSLCPGEVHSAASSGRDVRITGCHAGIGQGHRNGNAITVSPAYKDGGGLPGTIGFPGAGLESEVDASIFGGSQDGMVGIEAV